MQSERRASPRVGVVVRVAIRGKTEAEASGLSVGELEEIATAIRLIAAGYDDLSRGGAYGGGSMCKRET